MSELGFIVASFLVASTCFFESGDASTEPFGKCCQLIERSHSRPVESVFERDRGVNGAHEFPMDKMLARFIDPEVVCVAVFLGFGKDSVGRWDRPGRWEMLESTLL
jgi:hypothetical protein